MPWETMGAVDPHIQPERPHDITAPATIKPYYQQARRARELGQGDVTLFATATVDRLDMVEMVAMQYQGSYILRFDFWHGHSQGMVVQGLSPWLSGFQQLTAMPAHSVWQLWGTW